MWTAAPGSALVGLLVWSLKKRRLALEKAPAPLNQLLRRHVSCVRTVPGNRCQHTHHELFTNAVKRVFQFLERVIDAVDETKWDVVLAHRNDEVAISSANVRRTLSTSNQSLYARTPGKSTRTSLTGRPVS